jgi:hypothetical protein
MALLPLISRVPAHIILVQSRAQFKAKFGVDAPEWDSSQPVKDWIDQRAVEDFDTEIEYSGVKVDANGNPVYDTQRVCELSNFRLFPEVAQSINLLPEPLPPQGAMTALQLRMSQRKRPWPLELLPGERVVLSPGIGTIPVIDDGKTTATAGGEVSSSQMALLADMVAARVLEGLAAAGFTGPAPK